MDLVKTERLKRKSIETEPKKTETEFSSQN